MKCPVCSEKDLKSCVYVGMSTSTLMYCPPYYDEDGKYHSHDSNTHSTNYSCSHGHTWVESSTGVCPSCDFGKDSSQIRILNDKETLADSAINESDILGGKTLTFINGTSEVKKN